MIVALVVVVQLSLHSSVNQQTSDSNANAESRSGRLELVSNRINAPKQPSQTKVQTDSSSSSSSSSFPVHYTIFSTACSASQNWQSFMFFFFAHKVQQPGYVIRIASGCTQAQQDQLQKFHQTHISKLNHKFSVHFTPDFADVSGDNYKYYNKPFGVRHWMEYGLNYSQSKLNQDAIIMILDPDMILLRPLTYDFTHSNVIIHKSQRGTPETKMVMHGQPWASLYAFGDGPFRVDMDYVFANQTDSPALRTTKDQINHNYPGGPPYMATGKDMYNIVNAWCMLVPR